VNFMKMMKQAADLQQRMQAKQEELATQTVEHSSGGGMVTVVARGNLTIERVRLDPKVVDAADVEMLEDLVASAVNGALQAAREMAAREMATLTEGLGLPPGMKLPFS